MTLRSMFAKPVDRPIEGVIKADDEASLRLEIEEYVLTNEVEKRLETFLDAYNNYEGANGVWVSGFFGSGKSHLLKMLALLLENRVIDGMPALDLFLPKCGSNEIMRGDLKRAVGIPSRSILFNIDQKADVISKTQVDALLAVFVKVFDEMCGYYGKQGHIAQFERDMDARGVYQTFQAAYEATAGRPWHKGREQALLEGKNIARAYAQATGDDEAQALGILDKYRQSYRVSIEDFADQVNAYVEQQGPKFRLNFFVDEVGQYIADNTKLMTNLQTIAESLATKCRGRAWVIVTAQEEMDSVVGTMTKQQGNDFTKIQARFKNRMKLTSADVAEVIQKRLLTKTEAAAQELSDLYHAESNNFKTLFDFSDGAATYRNFQDRDHFIHSYPFIPYQFALFQSAIQNLSHHNAFEGKHSSVGERSMLGVFQQVAIQIGDHHLGQLATFDLMFEGIRTALKSSIQRAIIQAETHLAAPFAVRLLKTLFLVKYVKEFKPSVRNLCVLMHQGFDQSLPELRKRVEEALNLLEQQTYVQRNGEFYEYLTDEEKDVEQEIKNTGVEAPDVADELEKIVFDHVLKQRKIRYDNNGQDYPFTRKLDGGVFGREYELTLHVISPFSENGDNESHWRMQTLARDEVAVVMPADERLVRDLLMYKRTEKYVRQNTAGAQQEAIKRILSDKNAQNRDRMVELQQRVQGLLSKARLFVGGSELEISAEDPNNRVARGFHELIARVYSNVRMLRGGPHSENDIGKLLKQAQDGLFGNDVTVLAESEQEVLAHIQSNQRGGIRTTLKHLIERFERKPYGWPYAGILCTLAGLCARGKVEVRVDGTLLEEEALERALRNSTAHGNVVLEPQIEFSAAQVRALKSFFEDFFDAPPAASEGKALGKETAQALQDMVQQIGLLAAQQAHYPFLGALAPVLERLKALGGKPYTWYLTELAREEDALLDMKESTIDPVRKFMGTDDKPGEQRKIYDHAREFLRSQHANLTGLPTPQVEAVQSTLADPACFRGQRMQQVKADVAALQAAIQEQLATAVAEAHEKLADLRVRMSVSAEFAALSETQQASLVQNFDACKTALAQHTLLGLVRDTLRKFEEDEYPRLLTQMTAWAKPAPAAPASTSHAPEAARVVAQAVAEPRVDYVLVRNVKVKFPQAYLAHADDVERYLDTLREALLAEVRQGKRIQI